jgi:hypothetical protein
MCAETAQIPGGVLDRQQGDHAQTDHGDDGPVGRARELTPLFNIHLCSTLQSSRNQPHPRNVLILAVWLVKAKVTPLGDGVRPMVNACSRSELVGRTLASVTHTTVLALTSVPRGKGRGPESWVFVVRQALWLNYMDAKALNPYHRNTRRRCDKLC